MSLRAVPVLPVPFCRSLSLPMQLCEHITLDFSVKEGMTVQSMDGASVIFALLDIKPSGFEVLELPDGNTVSITIPCKSLKAALSHVRMGDVLVLEGGCGDTVIVRIEGSSGGKQIVHTLSQSLMVTDESQTIREMQFPCEVLLEASLLFDIIKEMKGHDTFTIKCSESALEFDAHDELNAVHVTLAAEQNAIKIATEETYEMSYKLAYFNTVLKNAKAMEENAILAQFGNDLPFGIMLYSLPPQLARNDTDTSARCLSGARLRVFIAPLLEP